MKVSQLPSLERYAKGDATAVWLEHANGNTLKLFYSYKTCVGFALNNGQRVVRENEWGPTTGRHLNAIDGGDKASRVDADTFARELTSALAWFVDARESFS